MSESLIEYVKNYLVGYLKGKDSDCETLHPWRKRWGFVIIHSFRVEAYANKIINTGDFNLKEDEILLIRIAAVLHDIGRTEERENHAEHGAEILKPWLHNDSKIQQSGIDIDRLLYFVRNHSKKKEIDKDICATILKDADILDEIGILSIFMATSHIDREEPFFFKMLLERVVEKEIPFCAKANGLLVTDAAKKILNSKEEYINKFILQLTEELNGDFEAFRLINEYIRS